MMIKGERDVRIGCHTTLLFTPFSPPCKTLRPGAVFVAGALPARVSPPEWGTRSLVAWPEMTMLFFALRLQALTLPVCYGMR